MKTLIFDSLLDFKYREDKKINGVSKDFASRNPGFEDFNASNIGCWDCSNCLNCLNCRDCSNCWNCSNCSNCLNCSNCSNCLNCRTCSNCRNCSDCSAFKSNPERIVSPILGRREKQTTYYWDNEQELVVCGCFRGSLENFKKRVQGVYGVATFGPDYLKWIKAVENYKKTFN